MNNWIVGNLQASFDTWNEKLTEIWSLVTTTPQAFRGGEIWNISETQMSHVTNVEAGHGLMRIGSSIIPFVNEFPHDGTLYRLMTTTPGDK